MHYYNHSFLYSLGSSRPETPFVVNPHTLQVPQAFLPPLLEKKASPSCPSSTTPR